MLRGRLFYIVLVLVLCFAAPSRAGDATVFSLWPVVDYRADEISNYRSLHLLGPLFKYEAKDDETEYALRPFFYHATDASGMSQTESFIRWPSIAVSPMPITSTSSTS